MLVKQINILLLPESMFLIGIREAAGLGQTDSDWQRFPLDIDGF